MKIPRNIGDVVRIGLTALDDEYEEYERKNIKVAVIAEYIKKYNSPAFGDVVESITIHPRCPIEE